MLTFKDGTLYCRKIEVPDVPISAVADIQESYNNYVYNVVLDDMKYLEELLQNTVKELSDVSLKVKVGKVVEHATMNPTTVGQDRYIPVTADFYLPGSSDPVKRNVELLRIPTMHDFGKFNFEGNLKVIMSQLQSIDSVSFDQAKNTLNITMPRMNLRMRINAKDIIFLYHNKRVPVLPILVTMLNECGDKTPISDYIRSASTLSYLKYTPGLRTEHMVDDTKLHSGLFTSLHREAYKLGAAREELNNILRLENGLGSILAEPCNGYPKGTVVDSKFIQDAYHARINHYVVRNEKFVGGYYYMEKFPLNIPVVPKGLKNSAYLRRLLPRYKDVPYFTEDVPLEHPIFFSKNHILSEDEMELLYSLGYTSLMVSSRKNGTAFVYSFVHEIVGNYVTSLSNLTDNIPADRYADEPVYYFDNPDLNPTEGKLEYLTAHDILALISLLGDVAANGNTMLQDRDNSFLKSVYMVDRLFSMTLRKVMREFVSVAKTSISSFVYGRSVALDTINPFARLYHMWYSQLTKDKVTATVDAMNLIAEVSQSCHIVTPDNGSGEILDAQRNIAVPYYGRLCPFETPAGFKLGTVNTRALGSKIENGVLLSPYRKVIRSGKSFRFSDTITWLTPVQEQQHRFASTLSFVKGPDGEYINNKILARVPNVDKSNGEPFTFKNINAFEMIDHYVDAFPEQSISPVAALVPFACCNDPVRLSYGVSQIKQGVLLHNSQKPRVRTPMHSQLFDFYNKNVYLSPCNGTVIEIEPDRYIKIKDLSGEIHTVTTDHVNRTEKKPYRCVPSVKVGEKVRHNQEIAIGILYPTDFIVRSPMDGYIINISRHSITLSSTLAEPGDFVDIVNDNVMDIPINPFRKLGTNAVFMNIHVHRGQHVKAGDILADSYTSRDGVYSPARCPLVAFVPTGYNHEDGVHATERASVAYTSMLASTLRHRESNGHSVGMQLKSPSDFVYHDAGTPVTEITKRTSASDKGNTKSVVRATPKAHGFYYHKGPQDARTNFSEYSLSMLSFNKLQRGDKMSGMHGNKGTISYVQPDSEAMQLANGRTVEFYLSPLGVPSRMNYGQMYEMPLSLVATVLDIDVETPAYNGCTPDEVAMLMRYTHDLCNKTDPDNWESSVRQVSSQYPEIPQELIAHALTKKDSILDWTGTFDEEGCTELYDPTVGEWLEGKVVIGFPTFNKLMQEAEEKLNVRGGIMTEEYSRVNSQPIDNVVSAKGQRMGEMELVDMAAYGMSAYLHETMHEDSDNANARNNMLLDIMGDSDQKFADKYCTSRAVNNLIHLLHGINVEIELPSEVNVIDASKCADYEELNLQAYLRTKFQRRKPSEDNENKTKLQEIMEGFDDDE